MLLKALFFTTALLGAGAPEIQQADIAWVAEGEFCEPETVLPLPDDHLLVSNVCGFQQPGSGFLSLLDKAGAVIDWRIVDGLDAPLGMAMAGDRLYVIDNNRVRVFRWPGYEPVQTIVLETTVANDIAVAEDNTLYVTDSAKHRVMVVQSGGAQSVLTGEARFKKANGIHLDGENLYVGGERLWRIDLRDNSVTEAAPAWLGDIDGIEQEADGTLQVTPVAGPLVRLGSEIEILGGEGVSSANHGYAPRLGLALIPTGFDNQVIAIRVDRGEVIQ